MIFHGGGGGAYLDNRDQLVNVGMMRYASSKDTVLSVQPSD